ncbi:hypothetical protein KHA90_03385 [Flavobacterium psychroterrae]|uniref:Uncharacterized protein n=1 Tax=Flavobacterium psychroterrae TaxID=2133767 RepID=A0ABS5P6Y7_9FLAO|nr:hypothetical protein [Flavobacterium psychroterrae]MBS7230057.1 hypothetical protein [Flavobacterium psychroterrae]
METNETQKLENLKKLIAPYFNHSKSNNDNSEVYTAQINISYYELGCVITNMLKMCVMTLDNDGHIKSSTNKNPINVSLILEMVLEMFPLNEFELLGEINQMVIGDN